MTTETFKYEPFNNLKCVDSRLVALAKDIQTALPDILFKGSSAHTYNLPEECKPEGIYFSLDIYDSSDPNIQIGELGVERYNNKYTITNRNIQDGRNSYGKLGQHKQSIHAKNILKIAKKTLAPITLKQHMDGVKQTYEQAVQSLRNKWSWDVNRKTEGAFKLAYLDMLYLYDSNYQPKDEKFRDCMNYLAENRESIDKYHDYNPNTCFVWVKANQVQYMRTGDKTPTIVATKDDLHEDIKGKMFVLDITDHKNFVEDIGLKENDSTYWIIE
jgi:hypothetical protein